METSALEAFYDRMQGQIASLEDAADEIGAFARQELAALEESAASLEQEERRLKDSAQEMERKRQDALEAIERRREEIAAADERASEELGRARARLGAERELWEGEQRQKAEQLASEQADLEESGGELKQRREDAERELGEQQAELAVWEAGLRKEAELLEKRKGELKSLEAEAREQGESTARAATVEREQELAKRATRLAARESDWQQQTKEWEEQRSQMRAELEHDQELLREAWARLEEERRQGMEARNRHKSELESARLGMEGQRAAARRATTPGDDAAAAQGLEEANGHGQELETVGAAAALVEAQQEAGRGHAGTGEPTLLTQFQLLQREINRRRVRTG